MISIEKAGLVVDVHEWLTGWLHQMVDRENNEQLPWAAHERQSSHLGTAETPCTDSVVAACWCGSSYARYNLLWQFDAGLMLRIFVGSERER